MKRKAAITGVLGLFSFLLVSACGGSEANPFEVDSQVVTTAARPVALAFAPDGRLFYAEQLTGNIRVIDAQGRLLEEPFAQVDAYSAGVQLEWGLMGLALDVDFETNHYVYAYFTQMADPGPPIEVKPVVVRFTERDNIGQEPTVLIDDLSATPSFFNAAGRIHSGPDGFLYVSTGDNEGAEAGDLSVTRGKLLRLDGETGAPAAGNPFADDPDADPRIFANGFREDFNFTFHPQSDALYGSDETPVTCSELNIIEQGNNYGWPFGEFGWGDCQEGAGTQAVHFFTVDNKEPGEFLSFVTVSALAFASGDVYPLMGDSLLVCESETNYMRRLLLSGTDLDQVTDDDVVVKDCEMDIAVSPDGLIYYSTDTEIRRLIPISE
jgi:glucose/arabinose dehydrogenase